MTNLTITALIVDDEPPARQRLFDLLATRADVSVIGSCGTGLQAVTSIEQQAPDILLLDVQMPELDGFGVLAQLAPEQIPVVVFVSAYDQHALRAFDVNALDYLLKPYSDERFHKALDRALDTIRDKRKGALTEQIISLLASKAAPSRGSERLLVRDGGRITFVDVSQIDWIAGAGVYVEIHAGQETFLHRDTLASLEERLDPRRFIRIHRSTIVNFDRFKELHPRSHGEYFVVLTTGETLKLSRGFRNNVEQRLKERL